MLLIAVFLLPMAGQTEQAATTPTVSVTQEIEPRLSFIVPLPAESYRVSAKFGHMKHPISKDESFYHTGIDMAAKLGTPILAPADGSVQIVEIDYQENRGYGKKIILQHSDGMATVFAHLNEISVEKGQPVKQGEQIGEVGNTGKSTGPHLHFEMWKNGEHVNPADYIAF